MVSEAWNFVMEVTATEQFPRANGFRSLEAHSVIDRKLLA